MLGGAKKVVLTLAIIIIAVASIVALLAQLNPLSNGETKQEIYVGVAFCGNTVEEGKQLIDKVKSYTNLFVLQSGELQRDFESVNELGDYAVAAGMHFLPYFGAYIKQTFSAWLETAKQRWGDNLLGVYYGDEPAGKMLDDNVELGKTPTGDIVSKTRYGDIKVQKPNNVVIHYEIGGDINLYQPENFTPGSAAVYATFFPNGTITTDNPTQNLDASLTYGNLMAARPLKDVNEAAEMFLDLDRENIEYLHNSTRVFTSDYVLPWFDYSAGYDVVLSQIGWNLTFAQQIATVRGAANLQHKDWGAFITWKYDTPPYLDNGLEILSQMRSAYECGAKYIVIFNYYDPAMTPHDTLREEHFQALESFWNDIVINQNVVQGSIRADSALVLPGNYGWGMRWEDDRIWGVFNANQTTQQLWQLKQTALAEHNLKIDIVYESPRFRYEGKYQDINRLNQQK